MQGLNKYNIIIKQLQLLPNTQSMRGFRQHFANKKIGKSLAPASYSRESTKMVELGVLQESSGVSSI